MIGEDIMVKVIKSNEGDLRLAIDAPKTIIIVRGEIFENKEKYSPLQKYIKNFYMTRMIAFAGTGRTPDNHGKCDCPFLILLSKSFLLISRVAMRLVINKQRKQMFA